MIEHIIVNWQDKMFILWLRTCCLLVIMMVLIGGLTRLSGSGLSIVEWKPVTGVVPPLNSGEWLVEFAKYQTSPEFQQNNSDMSLSNFKSIYWMEYIHRLSGRITGLLFLLPLIFFSFIGRIKNKDMPTYISVLGLFALQGFMGWYMVKSGLEDNPYVSPFRLANHLFIAIVIYSLLFWQLMKNNFHILLLGKNNNFKYIKILSLVVLGLLFCQIYLGGIVAGLGGGLVYNSFPLMGEGLVPAELSRNFIDCDFFYNPVFVQFVHRIIAFLLFVMICFLVILLIRTHYIRLRIVAVAIILAAILQITIGILTLLYMVPIVPALMHQLGAIILLSCVLWCYFILYSDSQI